MKNKNLSAWGHFTVVDYMGELGWEGCADEEILLSSCGLSPPTPGSPRVPFVNRPFESEIHGTVNLTYFCCVLLVTWCYRVLLSCYLRPK